MGEQYRRGEFSVKRWLSGALVVAVVVACGGEETTQPPGSGGSNTGAASGVGGEGGSCDEEVCDGVDNDCDAEVDEGFGELTCGMGICEVTVDECVNGQPQRCVPGDPNPAGETCDRLDDDCDGTVDEDCSCTDGDMQGCYTGNPTTQDVGECHGGTQTCSGGEWGPCADEVTPVSELCDGLDNNCDDVVDDGNPEGGGNCDTGLVGVCAAGTENCVSGQLECVQNVQPSAELCNGLDDDCDAGTLDGSADSTVGVACDGPDQDLCEEATTTCSNGNVSCGDNTSNTLDVCDGLDNDCDPASADGTEDPQGGTACDGSDTDLCIEGTRVCSNGSLVCTDNTPSTDDLCNGSDDDCDPASADGAEDPQTGSACDGVDSDLCIEGTRVCTTGSLVCSDNTTSTFDVCNSFDDDCDPGSADGSEDPLNGTGCDGLDSDLCIEGTRSCANGNLVCSDNSGHNLDVCDGLDNDCDAASADGAEDPLNGTNCDGLDTDLCLEGTRSCSSGILVCSDTSGSNLDVCDGTDNDCDPASPDGSEDSQIGVACDGNDTDMCIEGAMTCTSGALVCSDTTSSTPEVCDDNIDNDCDSLTDEGCCDTVDGPTLVDNILGWPNSGMQFTALTTSTLTSFVFENQGLADVITLFNQTTNTVIGTFSVPANSPPQLTVNVSWLLVAGHTYRLTNANGDNGRWVSYSSYPTVGSYIQVNGVWGQGALQTSFWFTFTFLEVCD